MAKSRATKSKAARPKAARAPRKTKKTDFPKTAGSIGMNPLDQIGGIPQRLLDKHFWEQVLKEGEGTVAFGEDWKVDLTVKPHRKVKGMRERDPFAGVIFKKRF